LKESHVCLKSLRRLNGPQRTDQYRFYLYAAGIRLILVFFTRCWNVNLSRTSRYIETSIKWNTHVSQSGQTPFFIWQAHESFKRAVIATLDSNYVTVTESPVGAAASNLRWTNATVRTVASVLRHKKLTMVSC